MEWKFPSVNHEATGIVFSTNDMLSTWVDFIIIFTAVFWLQVLVQEVLHKGSRQGQEKGDN